MLPFEHLRTHECTLLDEKDGVNTLVRCKDGVGKVLHDEERNILYPAYEGDIMPILKYIPYEAKRALYIRDLLGKEPIEYISATDINDVVSIMLWELSRGKIVLVGLNMDRHNEGLILLVPDRKGYVMILPHTEYRTNLHIINDLFTNILTGLVPEPVNKYRGDHTVDLWTYTSKI